MLGWFQTWSQLSKECLGPGRFRRAVDAEAERAGSGCGRGGVGSQLEEPKSHPQIRIQLDVGAATVSAAETCSRGGGAVTGIRGAPRVLKLSEPPLLVRKSRKGMVARFYHTPTAGEDCPFLGCWFEVIFHLWSHHAPRSDPWLSLYWLWDIR